MKVRKKRFFLIIIACSIISLLSSCALKDEKPSSRGLQSQKENGSSWKDEAVGVAPVGALEVRHLTVDSAIVRAVEISLLSSCALKDEKPSSRGLQSQKENGSSWKDEAVGVAPVEALEVRHSTVDSVIVRVVEVTTKVLGIKQG